MNFERGQDPLTALDIGRERKLKKGDKFLLVIPAIMGSYGLNPERIEEAIAIEDETSDIRFRISFKNPEDDFRAVEREPIEIRRIKWIIPEVAQGNATFINSRWIVSKEH